MSKTSQNLIATSDQRAHDQFDLVLAAATVLMEPPRRRNRHRVVNIRRIIDPNEYLHSLLTAKLTEFGAPSDVGSVAKSYIGYSILETIFGHPSAGLIDSEKLEIIKNRARGINEMLLKLGHFLADQVAAGATPDALIYLRRRLAHADL